MTTNTNTRPPIEEVRASHWLLRAAKYDAGEASIQIPLPDGRVTSIWFSMTSGHPVWAGDTYITVSDIAAHITSDNGYTEPEDEKADAGIIIGTLTRAAVVSAITEAHIEMLNVKTLIAESIARRDQLAEVIAALEVVKHSDL